MCKSVLEIVFQVEDMSLRDNATMCIVTIIKHQGELEFEEKAYNTLILSGLMPEMRTGLKSKKQVENKRLCLTFFRT